MNTEQVDEHVGLIKTVIDHASYKYPLNQATCYLAIMLYVYVRNNILFGTVLFIKTHQNSHTKFKAADSSVDFSHKGLVMLSFDISFAVSLYICWQNSPVAGV